MTDESTESGPSSVSITTDNQEPAPKTETKTEDSSKVTESQTSNSFASALDEDNRAYFTKKGWKEDPNAIIKSYRELEALNSKKTATATDTNQQQTQSNVPANASEYTFKLPEGIPAEGFYDNKTADAFKGWAHKAKLSPETAQVLHDEFVKHTFSSFTEMSGAQTKTLNERIQTSHDDLVKAWGSPEAPQFAQNLEMARRAMNHLDPDLKSALKARGVLIDQKGKDGKVSEVVADAVIMRALAKAGSTMFVEDSMFGSRPQGENPFDPKFSGPDQLRRQGEIVKKDRELAKTMIRAAGVEKDWAHMFR